MEGGQSMGVLMNRAKIDWCLSFSVNPHRRKLPSYT